MEDEGGLPKYYNGNSECTLIRLLKDMVGEITDARASSRKQNVSVMLVGVRAVVTTFEWSLNKNHERQSVNTIQIERRRE